MIRSDLCCFHSNTCSFYTLRNRGLVGGQGHLKDTKLDRAKNEPAILTVIKNNKTRNLVTLLQDRQQG